MDGATIAAKVAYGHAKAAQYLGMPFDQYRPSGPMNPLAIGNKIGSGIDAAFTNHGPANFDFGKPSDMKSPLNHTLVDDRIIAVFDYLVSAALGTYFIAGMTPSMPSLAVACNRTISVVTPGPAGSTVPLGASGYDGTTAATELALMTGWPASVLIDRLVRDQPVPESAGFATYRILLPLAAGTYLRGGDIIADDLGRRYDIITAELQSYGWRIAATQVAG